MMVRHSQSVVEDFERVHVIANHAFACDLLSACIRGFKAHQELLHKDGEQLQACTASKLNQWIETYTQTNTTLVA